MEALWSLEEKLNLTTQKAIALFACTTSILVIMVVCLATTLARKKIGTTMATINQDQPCIKEGTLSPVRVLMRAVRWSGPNKWEGRPGSQREIPTPLLLVKNDNNSNTNNNVVGVGVGVGDEVGWTSHNSTSAVWKKPILMGEKCELPRFSGLILYDQRGVPVHRCEEGIIVHEQEKSASVVRITLKDLL